MITCNKRTLACLSLLLATGLSLNTASATYSFFSKFNPRCATIVFQLGGFNASQGNAQDIGINGLIGDRFTISHHYGQNVILGLGYFINGLERERFRLMYGLNAFYLLHTTVQGHVIQEQLFDNLAYRYSLTNYPIYIAAKALINTNSEKYNITLDLGVGPNIINTGNFHEIPLNRFTLPDRAFSGQTNVAFSATAGIGIKFNNIYGRVPVEFGYRFFYLGQGSLNKLNNQIQNTLNTGNNYANALIFTLSV